MQIVTDDKIEAGKSPRGGFTKATLASWGVPWPPPKGWRTALRARAVLHHHFLLETRHDTSPGNILPVFRRQWR